MSKHTNEPWIAVATYKEGSAWTLRERIKSGRVIASIPFQINRPDEQKTADAHRIADCVNACEGINPEAIPDMIEALKTFQREIKRLPDEPTLTVDDVSTMITRIFTKAGIK